MGYVWVGVSGWGVLGYVWVGAGVFRCMWSMHECMQDEFSEYLLETRVITSADFNMYPIQKNFPHFLKKKKDMNEKNDLFALCRTEGRFI